MDAFAVDAIRTPVRRDGGVLAGVRADDLAATSMRALTARRPDIDWSSVDDFSVWLRRSGRGGQPQRCPYGRVARRSAGVGACGDCQSSMGLGDGRDRLRGFSQLRSYRERSFQHAALPLLTPRMNTPGRPGRRNWRNPLDHFVRMARSRRATPPASTMAPVGCDWHQSAPVPAAGYNCWVG